MSTPSPATNSWSFWVDRGGTFTDIVARKPDGELISHKLLSDNPAQYRDAVIQGIRHLMGLAKDARIPVEQIDAIKMGTTVATNALLEHKGEPTLLLTTRGFSDVLRIGYQSRPDLFAINIELPQMIYARAEELNERLDAQGQVLESLDLDQTRQVLQAAFDDGLRACAIVLMHSYRNGTHEQQAAAIAREIGFTQVTASSEASPLMKIVSRGDTAVVDAYLSPILKSYVNQVASELDDFVDEPGRLMFMQSNGGLTDAQLFNGKDAILSGPAGGVVGMVKTAEQAGFDKLIGFDMGGTSTDVCHYQGEYERAFETKVAGFRLQTPMMSIHTVAAGGGSVLNFDGSRFRVGPDSAGAFPGPACYRNGGPLTVTDCNVMLGKLQPDYFPKVFGPNADQPLDVEAVRRGFTEMAASIEEQTGQRYTPEQVAEGFLTIAVDNMANAIKHISTQRGYDIQDYVLCCFGGAGGQHACLVAEALGMKKVFLHPYSGVLSAYGMGLADVRDLSEVSVELPLDDDSVARLDKQQIELADNGIAKLVDQRVPVEAIETISRVHVKYRGSDTTLLVPFGSRADIQAAFEAEHRQRFGFISAQTPLIIEALQVEALGGGTELTASAAAGNTDSAEPLCHDLTTGSERYQAPFHQRDQLQVGKALSGPAVIIEKTATLVIEPGWQAVLTENNDILLEQVATTHNTTPDTTEADPITLEIFNNLYMHIAEQMGLVLQNTATSVNIKERLDFSCAIFDAEGELVANAPHMPVHLGSMSHSIKAVIAKNAGRMTDGDAYMLNDPYNGGTHLPDITVIKPVFMDGEVAFYVASRGHHADVGGTSPGSMPSDSSHIEQEGVLLDNVKVVDSGIFQEALVRDLFSSARYPARNIDVNIADLRAQLAACEAGMQALHGVVKQYGLAVVSAYMRHVQFNAEESVRRVIDVLSDGKFEYPLDDGSSIAVSISVDKANREATIDFTGTSGQHPHNFNAPLAVTHAAVLYVFRCLVNDQIPLNGGCLRPLNIIVPEGCMLNPVYPAAVVAGNVEVSQVAVDALFGALGVAAASQGTMNNLTWGNNAFQYYETLCGGSGATAKADGVSAVHTHMTNSRLTDPEILEWRFPVRLEEFRIRPDSGGKGQHNGGNGVSRRIRFLEKMDVSILSNRREVPPYGMDGGAPGELGRNTVIRANGNEETLAGKASAVLDVDDQLQVETPGGGGFGKV
ncbi:5-oxoprolinase [Saccharospirillum sp. MSK14-1]|uniref:hydantoinase B/oxoprolinase family protein n=1 Tax=Saccharospirillum sp. MSK14-1 TaxID=1897632 RepID=UPI000D3A8E65|nr:hydantoinase B/oxoprolinase family protein [Saccharospirillum sp. MSK14-1]PTY38004.1 5-oxoprolinase [Saccharospirillum sp. MSK14-1]